MELTVCEHIPGDECRLYGISDVHIGSPDCDEDLFRRDLAAIAADPQARVIINGDLLNYVTRRSKGDIYHEKYPPSTQKKLAREWLKPIAGKILCILGGNHDEGRSDEDAQPIEDLADFLGVRYCRGEVLLKLPVGKNLHSKPAVYLVYAIHGFTNARYIGAKALNLDRLKDIVLADIYLMSHTHTQHAHKDTYFVPDPQNGKVREIVRHYVNLGSYQRRGQYPIRKGLPAQVLGTPLVRLSGREKKVVVEL